MNLIRQLEQEEIKRLGKELPVFSPGDTVIVNVNVKEGDRKRVAGLRGRGDRQAEPRHQLLVHRAQDVLGRGRRAHASRPTRR